jgi:tetratricopeptide (TPR) repeat protein
VASKLKAAGALDQAATLYEDYLATVDEAPEAKAKVAYSLGTTYLDHGAYEKALRWFYEAETLGAGALADEVGQKIVHSLERLGRHHAAKAALDARVGLSTEPAQRAADDPVVARIGEQEVFRSDLDRALDDLPAEISRHFAEPAKRQEFLRKYVADELLWRKAMKLEYHEDPEVRRQHALALKQYAIGKFVEQEVVGKIEVDETDLQNYFEANRERYEQPETEDSPPRSPSFEEVRQAVERDYRMLKIQSAYSSMIESELATEDVELYPERLANDA